jgi:hypothetical protein
VALTVRAATFDWLFAGVRFDEVDGDILYVSAKDEETAAELRTISPFTFRIIATDILKR